MRTIFTIGLALAMSHVQAQTTNCLGATQVCSDITISGNSNGGGVDELTGSNQGCLGNEHQSSWFYFQPITSGTVQLTISTEVDYDFAIWATGNCNSLGDPIRCSFSYNPGNTGLMIPYTGQSSVIGCGFLGLEPCTGLITSTNNPVDDAEGMGGDAWVNALPVVAGQTYIMLVDNFTADSTPFTLDWTFTDGATLNCDPIVLSVALSEMIAYHNPELNCNTLMWYTESEQNNDYFTVERSTDGENWTTISKKQSIGNTPNKTEYKHEDYTFSNKEHNYYRLSQTDKNGVTQVLKIAVVDNSEVTLQVVKVVNTIGQEVNEATKGLVILIYEDGSTKQLFRY